MTKYVDKKTVFESNPLVDKVIEQTKDRISELETKLGIPMGNLKNVYIIHLPRFTEAELLSGDKVAKPALDELERIAKIVKKRIDSLPDDFRQMTLEPRTEAKIKRIDGKILEVDEDGKETEVVFKPVSDEIGDMIQDNLHYIGCKRFDNLFQFGLFRKGSKYPFAYSSYNLLYYNTFAHRNAHCAVFRLLFDNL